MISLIPFSLVQFAATILMLILAWQAFSRHPLPGAAWLGVCCCSVAIWALCDALTIASAGYELKLFWNQLSYLGIATVPVAWFAFSMDYTDTGRHLRRHYIGFFFIPAAITIALAFTNQYHGLIWQNIALRESLGSTWLSFQHGLGFWVSSVLSYILLLVGSFILVQPMVRSFKLRRSQACWMFAAVVAPWIANLAYLARWLPDVGTDLTSLAFCFSCLAISIAVRNFGLFDIMPVARASIIEGMQDGLLVMDQTGRVLDVNPAAQRILGAPGDEILGRPLYHFFPRHLAALGDYLTTMDTGDLNLHIHREGQSYNLRLTMLAASSARAPVRLAVLHNITEREQLISQLQAALSEVQTLEGLLPICAECKRIRNDEGYWTQLEEYLSSHSKAQLTHGLCPSCMEKLYGNWLRENERPPDATGHPDGA